ncbi:hypothetical protein [Lysinibacillus xylanilyticus]|uniref:Uncharacterized protein n=1 Tax=Lysinibacillus xylanilyticus TaxID=582475 RepID=A0ABT4ER19_9BACI|nr:hypothetical protein [Lysinibacillus xylanilyticus]MCY9548075.1 hypothetical protein [Lysinibacillus xylanilyticus]
MKKILQFFILLLVVYLLIHILFGLDFNPVISLITKISQIVLALFLLIYVSKLVGEKKN